jgi:hypothetical protein
VAVQDDLVDRRDRGVPGGAVRAHVGPESRCQESSGDWECHGGSGGQRELSKSAIKPWTWNKGKTITVESDSVSLYTETIFRTEEARLSCVSGTPLGRLVVPEVWRKSATSDGSLTIPATDVDSAVTSDVEERESSNSPSRRPICSVPWALSEAWLLSPIYRIRTLPPCKPSSTAPLWLASNYGQKLHHKLQNDS